MEHRERPFHHFVANGIIKHKVALNYKYMAITWQLCYSASLWVERPVTSSNSLMTTKSSQPHY